MAVWTGAEMVVWGGYGERSDEQGRSDRRDGAAYDPESGRWRRIADAPIGADFEQRGVWTGAEVLVWGSRGASADPVGTAAYDPDADAWRRLPDAPLPPVESAGAAWTGRELLVWGSQALAEPAGQVVAAAYDPAADAWRRVPDPPLPAPRFAFGAQWTGEHLVLWGGEETTHYELPGCEGPVCNDLRQGFPEAVAYDPAADVWRRLPDAPRPLRRGARALGWTGREVLIAAAASDAPLYGYDPWAGSTRLLGARPVGRRLEPAVWTGAELLVLDSRHRDRVGELAGGARFDYGTGEFAALPPVALAATEDQTLVWTGRQLLVWGGSAWAGSSGPVTRSGQGVAYTPGVAPTATDRAEADYEVTADVEVRGAAPFSVTTTDPGPLRLPGYADHLLSFAAGPGSDLLLGQIAYDGNLAQAEGVLLSLAPECGATGVPDEPELGRRACEGVAGPIFVPPDRPVAVRLTVASQAPPFAPTPGVYRAEATVPWWQRRPAPQPYPDRPDGTAAFTIVYTVTGRTAVGRDPRPGQRAERAALDRAPCHNVQRNLANGDPDGTDGALAVETDGLGWFGNASYGSRLVRWNPPGPLPAFGRVGLSQLVVDGTTLNECSTVGASRLVAETPASLRTEFTLRGVAIRVDQQLSDVGAQAAFTQRYELTNTGPAPVQLSLLRHLEDEVFFLPAAPAGGGLAASGADGSTLHAFAGTDPDAAAPYVAITGDLDGQPPGRWAVRDTDPANPGVLSQAASTVVAGDADGDSISDGPLRPILQQQWDVALEPAGRAVLTIVTRFGIAAPRDVVT